MTPQTQLYYHDPDSGVWGDCYRTCIASILDLPPHLVPHFLDGGPDNEEVDRRIQDWLGRRGLTLIQLAFPGEHPLQAVLDAVASLNPGLHYLLGGDSSTGCGHVVVCRDNQIVHDPSRNQSGIIAPQDDFWWVMFIGKRL